MKKLKLLEMMEYSRDLKPAFPTDSPCSPCYLSLSLLSPATCLEQHIHHSSVSSPLSSPERDCSERGNTPCVPTADSGRAHDSCTGLSDASLSILLCHLLTAQGCCPLCTFHIPDPHPSLGLSQWSLTWWVSPFVGALETQKHPGARQVMCTWQAGGGNWQAGGSLCPIPGASATQLLPTVAKRQHGPVFSELLLFYNKLKFCIFISVFQNF